MDETQGLGSVGTLRSTPAAAVGGATQGLAPAAAQQVASATLLMKVETLLGKLDAKAKAEEAKATTSVKTIVAKYWPMAVGIGIAATRFIHL